MEDYEFDVIYKKARSDGNIYAAFLERVTERFWLYFPYVWRDRSNENLIREGAGAGLISEDQANEIRNILLALRKDNPAEYQNVRCVSCQGSVGDCSDVGIVCLSCGKIWQTYL